MSESIINRQWVVAEHPTKELEEKHFGYKESSVRPLQEGEVLLKTHYLNIAPVMRMYMMKDGGGYSSEKLLSIGDVIHGRGVAEIIDSRHSDYQVGEYVHGQVGWQTYKISSMTDQEKFVKMTPRKLPVHYGLSALGMTGYSAYCGFFHRGYPHPDDTVLVSGAAGGVGSLVVQMAKTIGCKKIVGIAGGKVKCDLVKELGAHDVIDYKQEDVAERLSQTLAEGYDVFFDNVGGEIMDNSLLYMRAGARVVQCGAISEYLREGQFIPQNVIQVRKKAASLNGFFVYRHRHQYKEAEDRIASWIGEGVIKPLVDIEIGFERMPHALMGLYSGNNIGKKMVQVAQTETIY